MDRRWLGGNKVELVVISEMPEGIECIQLFVQLEFARHAVQQRVATC